MNGQVLVSPRNQQSANDANYQYHALQYVPLYNSVFNKKATTSPATMATDSIAMQIRPLDVVQVQVQAAATPLKSQTWAQLRPQTYQPLQLHQHLQQQLSQQHVATERWHPLLAAQQQYQTNQVCRSTIIPETRNRCAQLNRASGHTAAQKVVASAPSSSPLSAFPEKRGGGGAATTASTTMGISELHSLQSRESPSYFVSAQARNNSSRNNFSVRKHHRRHAWTGKKSNVNATTNCAEHDADVVADSNDAAEEETAAPSKKRGGGLWNFIKRMFRRKSIEEKVDDDEQEENEEGQEENEEGQAGEDGDSGCCADNECINNIAQIDNCGRANNETIATSTFSNQCRYGENSPPFHTNTIMRWQQQQQKQQQPQPQPQPQYQPLFAVPKFGNYETNRNAGSELGNRQDDKQITSENSNYSSNNCGSPLTFPQHANKAPNEKTGKYQHTIYIAPPPLIMRTQTIHNSSDNAKNDGNIIMGGVVMKGSSIFADDISIDCNSNSGGNNNNNKKTRNNKKKAQCLQWGHVSTRSFCIDAPPCVVATTPEQKIESCIKDDSIYNLGTRTYLVRFISHLARTNAVRALLDEVTLSSRTPDTTEPSIVISAAEVQNASLSFLSTTKEINTASINTTNDADPNDTKQSPKNNNDNDNDNDNNSRTEENYCYDSVRKTTTTATTKATMQLYNHQHPQKQETDNVMIDRSATCCKNVLLPTPIFVPAGASPKIASSVCTAASPQPHPSSLLRLPLTITPPCSPPSATHSTIRVMSQPVPSVCAPPTRITTSLLSAQQSIATTATVAAAAAVAATATNVNSQSMPLRSPALWYRSRQRVSAVKTPSSHAPFNNNNNTNNNNMNTLNSQPRVHGPTMPILSAMPMLNVRRST